MKVINRKHRWRNTTRDNRSGFTLMEILVVVAILALLVAILFPVAGRWMERAKLSKDVAQLRAMGVATMLYAADFQRFPGAGFWVVGRVREDVVSAPSFDHGPLTRNVHLAEKLFVYMQDPLAFANPYQPPSTDTQVNVGYRHNWNVYGRLEGNRQPIRPSQLQSSMWAISNRDERSDTTSPKLCHPPLDNKRHYFYLDGRVERLAIEEDKWDPTPFK
jgi:prepilin-type N-terminal cleavage/methylation domain-containing protein